MFIKKFKIYIIIKMDANLDYDDNQDESMFELNRDIALKALLFGMVFYIIDSNLVTKIIDNCLPTKLIERQVFKAVIFSLLFYLIMSQL
jgi:hypothetical protein